MQTAALQRFGQFVSLRCIWSVISRYISGATVALLSTQYRLQQRHLSCRESSFPPLYVSVRVQCLHPSYHRCFSIAVVQKFMAAKILLRRWRQTIVARQGIPLIQSQSVQVQSHRHWGNGASSRIGQAVRCVQPVTVMCGLPNCEIFVLCYGY